MLTNPLGRVLLAILVVVVVAVAWFALQVDPIFAGKGKEVIITVHDGDSMATVLAALHAKGVIASPLAFRLEDEVLGAPTLHGGTFRLRQGSSFAAVRKILNSPPNVVVIEATPGLTLHEIALEVASLRGVRFANEFAKVATNAATPSPYGDGSSLEGLIGAGSYLVTAATTPSQLAHRMVKGFEREATAVGLTPTTKVDGLDAYQLIIAASIDEKEGYYPRYFPKVARVIFNRLARGGPLQMDSTVLYYFKQDGGTVTPAMLRTQTPYNTYLYAGLTPTPICTVSKGTLHAVLHAPPGPWLYFTLVDKNGTMAFATTFKQQLKNEAKAARNGVG